VCVCVRAYMCMCICTGNVYITVVSVLYVYYISLMSLHDQSNYHALQMGQNSFLFHELLPKYCKRDINAGTYWKESFVECVGRGLLLLSSV
jgi:hypothetical protein